MNVISKPDLRAELFLEGKPDLRMPDPTMPKSTLHGATIDDPKIGDSGTQSQAASQVAVGRPTVQRDLEAEKIDQVRDLLFGDFKRLNDARFNMIDARMRELEVSIHRRLEALQTRIEALSGEVGANQRSAFNDLARGVEDLSELVKRIAKD